MFSTELQQILIANAVVMVIPGVNFSLVTRVAILEGFKAAVWSGLGITTAIMVHVLLAMFSLNIILYTSPLLFTIIKYFGCLYIIYLGSRHLYLSLRYNQASDQCVNGKTMQYFRTGLMVDIFNPYISLFYLSLFTPLIGQQKTSLEFMAYALCIAILVFGWFSLVGAFFARHNIRTLLHNHKAWVQRISCFTMYYFAYRILAS